MGAYLPREHGLIAWVCVPLVAAMLLASTAACGLAAVTVLTGFLSFNAARKGAWPMAGAALVLAAGIGAGALVASAAPLVLAGALAVAGVVAGAVALEFGGVMPRNTGMLVVAILGLSALGAAVAVSAGADPARSATVALVLAAWQVAGLWWVRRQMARVLRRRLPWRAGVATSIGLAAAAMAAGCWYGLMLVPAVLLLYPLRMVAHAPPRSAREAGRVGMTELGWTLVAVAFSVLTSG